ncbi:O-antigen ligase family protein [Methylophaga sp.]|uniref:O-antigen ligase family protein n=1 Tax=Methylophaga sp. TaxID=2024840 RepID=UPI003A8E47F2
MKKHYLTEPFKLLMAIGLGVSFMPSLMRLGSSSVSLSYGYILLCFLLMIMIILKDKTVLSFYNFQASRNKLLMMAITFLFMLHLLRFIVDPDEFISRTLMSLIIFLTCFWYFSFVFYNDSCFFERAYIIISLGIIINLIAAIMQKQGMNLGTSYYDGYDRFTGLFSNPNQLAIFSSTTFVYYVDKLCSGTSYRDKKSYRGKLWPTVMLLACIVLLVLSGSKTNVIVSGGILVVFIGFYIEANILSKLLFAVFVGILSLVLVKESQILVSVNPRLFDILSSLSFDSVLEYRTIDSRMDLWRYSWDIGMSYPYIGEGVTSTLPGSVPHSHNLILDYLRIFGPLGMVGMLLFIYSLVFFRIQPSADRLSIRRARVCKFSIFAYLLSNMMSDSMGPQTVFFLSFFVAYLFVHASIPVNYTNINSDDISRRCIKTVDKKLVS